MPKGLLNPGESLGSWYLHQNSFSYTTCTAACKPEIYLYGNKLSICTSSVLSMAVAIHLNANEVTGACHVSNYNVHVQWTGLQLIVSYFF